MNKKVKIIASVTVLILLLVSVPVAVYLVKQRQEIRKRAAPTTELSLGPSVSTVYQDDTFSVDVLIETGDNLFTAADITLTFDSSQLEVVDASDILPGLITLVPASISVTPGQVRFAGYAASGQEAHNEVLASVYFHVLTNASLGSSAISFGSSTTVAGEDESGPSILAGTTPTTVTIESSEPILTPTPTSTPIPTPTPEGACLEEGEACGEAISEECCEGLSCVILDPEDQSGICEPSEETPTPTPDGGETPTPTSAPDGGETPTPTSAPGGDDSVPTSTPTTPIVPAQAEVPEAGISSPTLLSLIGGGALLIFGLLSLFLI